MTVIVIGNIIEDASIAADVGLTWHDLTVEEGGDGSAAMPLRLTGRRTPEHNHHGDHRAADGFAHHRGVPSHALSV